MKKMVLIVNVLLIIFITGCADSHYSTNANWKVANQDFIDNYSVYYLAVINNIAINKEVVIEFQIEFTEDKEFRILYTNDDIYLSFRFINSPSSALYSSSLVFFNETGSSIIDSNNMLDYMELVNEVTKEVVYDFQGGVYVYEDLLNEMNNDEDSQLTYHFDDYVGKIGYRVNSGNQYTITDDREFVSFSFRGLLRNIKVKDVWE